LCLKPSSRSPCSASESSEEVKPEADQPKVSAIDGRMYKAQGPKWHKGDRQKEIVSAGLRNVDTESKWSNQVVDGNQL